MLFRSGYPILQVARQVLAARDIIGDQRIADVVGIGLDRDCEQVAPDPGPDRLERGARDAALMLVRRRIVDQERLEGAEELSRRIADAGRRLARFAHRAPHLLQQEIAAWYFAAAQQRAFELRNQQSAGGRRELPQILP